MGILDTVSELISGSGPKTNNQKYKEALAELQQYDIGRSAYFDVEIYSGKLRDASTLSSFTQVPMLKFLCHSAELPGETSEIISQRIYGISEDFPIRTSLNNITLSFYTRGGGVESTRLGFLYWMNSITGRGSAMAISSSTKPNADTSYNVLYKKDFIGDIKITHYSITGEKLVSVMLEDAFPVSINQSPLSWDMSNRAQSLQVTFSYKEYQYVFHNVENNGKYSRGLIGEALGLGIKGAAIYNSVRGAIKSHNPLAAGSNLPALGLSNFTFSSLAGKIGL